MVIVIVACEIGFWVFIALGLVARYLLRRPRAGAALLTMAPVTDLVLLIAAGADLHAGGTASEAHSLAALYLGFSIANGHQMIRWADTRFAHRFAGRPAPTKLDGFAYTRSCWADALRTAVAAGVATCVVWLLTSLATDPSKALALTGIFPILGTILAVEVIWAAGYTLWPRKQAIAK